jgi:oxepin-CoA hydrolase/3-oxo-5,6-dehydrosuberyl-CoA semialdehyde dehydrogenase
MPCIAKPATATAYLAHALVSEIEASELLPPGALQRVVGGVGDLLDRLDGQDVVTFTGSADTAARLRIHPNLVRCAVPFNAEADSLNAAILGPDVEPGSVEFGLFVDEVVREMSAKAGQKCTAIRRAIVPRPRLDAVASALRDRLAALVVGDPALEGVQMGALASRAQQSDVATRVATLARDCETVFGATDGFSPRGERTAGGAFFAPTLLLCPRPLETASVHEIEAFGPVATLMPYDGLDEAITLAARGRGSLVATLVTASPAVAAEAVPRLAAWHGRLHVLDAESAGESTGHGSPLPGLKHGGPGRA